MTPMEAAESERRIMAEVDRIRDHVNDRLHDHGKHISRLEGVFEERTLNLQAADREAREEIGSLRRTIDDFRREVTADLKLLGVQVTEGRVKMGIIVGLEAAASSVGASILLDRLLG